MEFLTRFLIIILSIVLIRGNENTVFIYNHIENCKLSDYYDVNYFLCRQCDPQSNLVPSANGKGFALFFFLIIFQQQFCKVSGRVCWNVNNNNEKTAWEKDENGLKVETRHKIYCFNVSFPSISNIILFAIKINFNEHATNGLRAMPCYLSFSISNCMMTILYDGWYHLLRNKLIRSKRQTSNLLNEAKNNQTLTLTQAQGHSTQPTAKRKKTTDITSCVPEYNTEWQKSNDNTWKFTG